jgi:hypothetical protein
VGGIGFRTGGKSLIVSTEAIGSFGNKSGTLLNGNFVASATNPHVRRKGKCTDDPVNQDITLKMKFLEALDIMHVLNFSQQPLPSNFNHIKHCIKTVLIIWVGNVD